MALTPGNPDAISLFAQTSRVDEALYLCCIDALSSLESPPGLTTILDISSRQSHTEPELLQLLAADNPPAMRVRLGEFSSMAIGLPQRQLQFVLMDLDVETGAAIDVSVRVLRSLMSAGLVTSAWIERGSGDSEILPQLPLADTRTHAIAATDAEVTEHYDDVEAFWSCWDAVERIGEYRLATRAIDAVHPADFLDAVQDGHRAMARLAKPGAARYYRVSLRSEDEREVYLARGESRLRPVAYFDADARADFSCVLGAGEHIAGWEIDGLRDWIHVREALPDGSPLREVRVMFTYEQQARSERRPLLDVGARVFYLDEGGSLVEFTS